MFLRHLKRPCLSISAVASPAIPPSPPYQRLLSTSMPPLTTRPTQPTSTGKNSSSSSSSSPPTSAKGQPPNLVPRPLVLSGPSGTGKSTLLRRLFSAHPRTFAFSVSHTTRPPRPGERDGVHYHFVSRAVFEELKSRGDFFVETAEFGGNLYGTSVGAVEEVGRGGGRGLDGEECGGQGRCCVLDIEMEGVKQIRNTDLNARFLFLAPPSMEELERRLRNRGTETEESIRRRVEQARKELDYAAIEGSHDKVVVNDDLDRAYREMEEWIMTGENLRT